MLIRFHCCSYYISTCFLSDTSNLAAAAAEKKYGGVWYVKSYFAVPVMYACMLSRFSCVQLFADLWTLAHQALLSIGFSKQEHGSGLPSLLQGIFPTQGSNPGLPNCRRILYCLSHQGNPRILEWVAYPFFRGTSWPRNQIRVSWIAGGFFTSWAT